MQMADKSTAGIPSSAAYRPDIDGLRGFGALLVLWFHFRETWNDSAYKGADLTNSTFFVVSGFVITLSVLRAQARNPLPINLPNTAGFALLFLCRRLQRLVMTQLFVTFITMAIFLATLVPGPQLLALVTTAQYSVIGGANVLFGSRDEDTFYVEDETTDVSLSRNPLMHTWYLGVEEQVYLLFPWIFAAAHFCTERWHASPYVVFGAVFLASLTCALNVDRRSAAGFFLLQYRGWEVVFGVLTCHALVHSNVLGNKWRVLFWPQISFVLLESVAGWLFQYPEHSLTATVCGLAGTAVFLISGHGYEWNSIYSFGHSTLDFRREVPLLNYVYGLAAPAYLGRISYSMYLWHFPVAVFCAHFKTDIQEAIGSNDAVAFSLQLILVTALSMFTHHMVENPFRWWKPGNQYGPALVVLLLVVGIELWLRFVSYKVLDVAESNFLRPDDEKAPPIFGITHLIAVLAIALAPAPLFSPRPPSTFCDKSMVLRVWIPLGSFLLFVVYWITSSETNILPAPGTDDLLLETTPLAKTSSSTFWNWRGGSHSFATFGCGCQQGGRNARPPPGASTDPELPLCFDSDHWGSEPHEGYKSDARLHKAENKDCTEALGLEWDVDEIWKQCLEPGRPLPPSQRRPVAFVFGSSTSQRLRVAVANAIGGEFAVLGYALAMFADPHIFSFLSIDRATNKIRFDRESAKQIIAGKTDATEWKGLSGKAQYVERIGQLLDKRLGEGDILFYAWLPPTIGNLKQQRTGLVRLGEVARSRGATLVLTTGQYHYDLTSAQEGYVVDFSVFLKRQRTHEKVLREVAMSEDSIVHWPFGEQFCGDRCSRSIVGTNETASSYNSDSKYDWWHPSAQAEAFLSPYLCSHLKQHQLLQVVQPERHRLEFRHDGLEINLAELRTGKDQYHYRVYRLPEHLRRSAITHIQYEFEPSHHQYMVHHATLYSCKRHPEGLIPGLEESFSAGKRGGYNSIKNICGDMIWTHGMESAAMNFPVTSSNEQTALLIETEFVLVEVHYKAPLQQTIAVATGSKLESLQKLQEHDRVWDSSGLSATFMSQEQARRLGTTFKFVQLLEVGPRATFMLSLPPGRDREKVTSVCPSDCLAHALERINQTEVSIVGSSLHAPLAATAMYGEILNLRENTSTIIHAIPDYQKYMKHPEKYHFPRKEISITRDHALKVTCNYNTTGRVKETRLGISLQEEMCFLYFLVSPPLRDFSQCFHIDERIDARENTFCRAQCGSLAYPKFWLPRGSTNWSSTSNDRRLELGESWPSQTICEH